MKRLSVFLFCVFAISLRAAVPPAEKLLAADTLGFLTVPDWSRAQTNFSQSALGQLWADPSLKAAKEKFVEKFTEEKIKPLEKELGISFSNYLSLARGQFTIAITQNGWDGKSEKTPGFIWLLDTKEKSSELKTNLAELRKKWIENGKKIRTDKIRDVEFTTVIVDSEEVGKSLEKLVPKPKPGAAQDEKKTQQKVEWVIGQSDSLLIISDAAKDVEKVMALQSGSSVPALADQAAFAANVPMLRDAQVFAWVNTKTIMGTLAKSTPSRNEAPSLLGAPPSMDKILNALGLSGVQTIGFNMKDAGDGSAINVAINVPDSGRKGLFRILAVDTKDASPPPFVPADAVKFSRWRIDLQKAWNTVESVMMEISPAYGGFSKLILDTAGKDKDPNFDFRKMLLANLGDDVITYEKAPRGQTAADLETPPSLTLVGAKNADQLAASLKAITSIFPPQMAKYNEREFLGRKIYSFAWPSMSGGPPSTPLNYASSGGYVAFSSDAAVIEEYLRSGEGKSRSLRELTGLNDAAQRVGGMGTGYFSFENRNETVRATFESAKKNSSSINPLLGLSKFASVLGAAGMESKGTNDWIDVSLLPAYERISKYFHFDVSAVNVSPSAITFKVFAPTPPQLRK